MEYYTVNNDIHFSLNKMSGDPILYPTPRDGIVTRLVQDHLEIEAPLTNVKPYPNRFNRFKYIDQVVKRVELTLTNWTDPTSLDGVITDDDTSDLVIVEGPVVPIFNGGILNFDFKDVTQFSMKTSLLTGVNYLQVVFDEWVYTFKLDEFEGVNGANYVYIVSFLPDLSSIPLTPYNPPIGTPIQWWTSQTPYLVDLELASNQTYNVTVNGIRVPVSKLFQQEVQSTTYPPVLNRQLAGQESVVQRLSFNFLSISNREDHIARVTEIPEVVTLKLSIHISPLLRSIAEYQTGFDSDLKNSIYGILGLYNLSVWTDFRYYPDLTPLTRHPFRTKGDSDKKVIKGRGLSGGDKKLQLGVVDRHGLNPGIGGDLSDRLDLINLREIYGQLQDDQTSSLHRAYPDQDQSKS